MSFNYVATIRVTDQILTILTQVRITSQIDSRSFLTALFAYRGFLFYNRFLVDMQNIFKYFKRRNCDSIFNDISHPYAYVCCIQSQFSAITSYCAYYSYLIFIFLESIFERVQTLSTMRLSIIKTIGIFHQGIDMQRKMRVQKSAVEKFQRNIFRIFFLSKLLWRGERYIYIYMYVCATAKKIKNAVTLADSTCSTMVRVVDYTLR